MIWGKKKKTLQLGFGFFVGKVETIKESEWTACRGYLERRWSPGLCGQDPGRTLPAPGRPRSHWSCFTGTRRGQALGPAPREGKSDMVPPAVRWGRHSHKPPRHSGAHALGTPGEERERPAAALGLKSKTTRLDCEPVPDRPAQPRPGAGHRAGRVGAGASDRCLQPQPPASLSSPRNNVGEQGLLAPRFTGRVETLRQEEGSSPAQAATMPPRATPSFLACGGANPRTGRGRPPAAGGLMDPRPARIYVFLLKMSPEVHSNARSRCQARARLILIKGKDDSLRERNRVPPSGK